MTRSPPWTPAENAALVGAGGLYFAMLDKAVAGKPYNKAAMIRLAQSNSVTGITTSDAPLMRRTKQSIEFKLMNASACHAAIDPEAETMDGHGYRAMPNYQAALLDAMRTALGARGNEQWAHRASA